MFWDFEWDVRKNKKNLEKHGIDFIYAARIFESPLVEWRDMRSDYGELRFCAVGVVEGIKISIVYTLRDGRIRLISARRANAKERQAYRSVYS